MTTKQEYQEALNRMEEAYYSLDNSMGAMSGFKEDINLITELVNEHFKEKDKHFEEKAETNLEVTNFEHYKDEILEYCVLNLAVVKGRPTLCYKTNCNDCDFKINQIGCREKVKDWLKSPYKKPTYKLSQFEYDLINTYSHVDDRCKLNGCYQLKSLKEKGYFKNVDKNELIKDIIDNCEVV